MRRIFFFLLGITACLGLAAQTPSATLACFVSDFTATNVRNAPNGEVVRQLPAGGIYTLTVCNPKGGWWQILNGYVEAMDEDAIEIPGEVWVHSSVLGLSTRNYGRQALPLRAEPRANAPETGRITVAEDLVHPLDVTNDRKWVKVSWGRYTGWIEAKWLCANPVTTCS